MSPPDGVRTASVASRLWRLAGWGAMFVGFGLVGRASMVDGTTLSLVWPAAGIGALWVMSGWGRSTAVDLAVMAACTFAVNWFTGASYGLGLIFVGANLLQATLFTFGARRLLPDVRGLGGDRPLSQVRDLGLLAVAAVAACAVAALIGSSLVWAESGSWTPVVGLLWFGRNLVGLVGIVVFGLLAMSHLQGRSRGSTERITPQLGLLLAESVILAAVTLVLYTVVFVVVSVEPLVFLLLATTVWAGIRLPPVAVVAHGLLGGTLAVVFTLNGVGPFMIIDSVPQQAMVAQIFVMMSVVTGLALAFSRSERDAALSSLRTAQHEMVERARLLDSVLETMHEGIAVVDSADNVLIRNRAGREMLGLGDQAAPHVRSPEEVGLFHPDGRPVRTHELPHKRALAGDHVDTDDYIVRSSLVPKGRVLEISAQQLERSPDLENPRVLLNFRDVTADRQDRDALASFAGVVAHDLLSPLTVVEGWSEALSDDLAAGAIEPDSGLPKVQRIQAAAQHMREFIAELLSWTVARGQAITLDAVDLSAVAGSIAEMRSVAENRPRITVVQGLRAWGDEVLLRQLLDNLIGNAVKYVAPGVRPEISVTGKHGDDALELRVSDNGIGIPADQREQIFDTFHRAHAQNYRGTGLGLSICRQIVQRHGGTIRVETAPTGGSTFVVTLPTRSIAAAEPDEVPQATAPAEPSMRS